MGAMTSFNLASNNLGPEGAKIIGEAIKVSNCMAAISLANNALLTKEAGKVIGDMLKGNSTLKELDLSSNYDYQAGAKDGPGFAQELADGIKDNGAMTSLNLADNWLQAEGAKHIAGALKVSKCVLAIILAPLSCQSDQYFNCWCLLLSPGYEGVDESEH
jgi:hypothetical protein